MNLCEMIKYHWPNEDEKVQFTFFKVYLKQLEKESLINRFVERTLPYWSQIKEKDLNFFLKNFSSVVGDTQRFISEERWRTFFGGLSNDDLDAVWEYVHSFVEFAVEYEKTQGHDDLSDKWDQ